MWLLRTQFLLLLALCAARAVAATDTLRVMAYNVLYYGDRPACQGPHSLYHDYLKTIVQFTNPDVLGLEKLAAIPMYVGDVSGSAPAGFADSVLQYGLNTAFPGRYQYCPYTNGSAADNLSVLFYDQHKLGYCGIVSSYSNITDFNTYKLYYKSPGLAFTHDTIFLYVTLNHTQSGSGTGSTGTRTAQISGTLTQLHTVFSSLPNVINMGDFNFHNSSEGGYQLLVAPTDTGFRFYDPPFYPDMSLLYPADWDTNPSSYPRYLTTSTRLSSSVPNSCGTNGGGKSWYDHIFLSSALVNGWRHVQYIPHSYRTIGNDGYRVGISINDAPTNTSAPATVINALYQMSNKYPVMVDVAVDMPTTSVSEVGRVDDVQVVNPLGTYCELLVADKYVGKNLLLEFFDMSGRLCWRRDVCGTGRVVKVPVSLVQGAYIVRVSADKEVIFQERVIHQ